MRTCLSTAESDIDTFKNRVTQLNDQLERGSGVERYKPMFSASQTAKWQPRSYLQRWCMRSGTHD